MAISTKPMLLLLFGLGEHHPETPRTGKRMSLVDSGQVPFADTKIAYP